MNNAMKNSSVERSIPEKKTFLESALVSVKRIIIRDKPMTFAGYQRLKKSPLMEIGTMEMRGMPWGKVQHFWGRCKNDGKHLHIVWQDEDVLRRDCIDPAWPKPSLASAVGHSQNVLQSIAMAIVLCRLVRAEGTLPAEWDTVKFPHCVFPNLRASHHILQYAEEKRVRGCVFGEPGTVTNHIKKAVANVFYDTLVRYGFPLEEVGNSFDTRIPDRLTEDFLWKHYQHDIRKAKTLSEEFRKGNAAWGKFYRSLAHLDYLYIER